jgi:hypothetical protein
MVLAQKIPCCCMSEEEFTMRRKIKINAYEWCIRPTKEKLNSMINVIYLFESRLIWVKVMDGCIQEPANVHCTHHNQCIHSVFLYDMW